MTPSSPSTNAKLHILYGLQSLDFGGLERIVVDLARVALQKDHRVTILCLERPGTLAEAARALGAEVLCLDKPPGRIPSIVGRAAELFTKLQPNILHTHTVGALWYFGPAAKLAKIPVLHTEHIDNVGKSVGISDKLKTRLLWHKAARYADRFCCVSEDVARSAGRWRTVPRYKLETVLNGIDTDRYADRSTRTGVREILGIPSEALVVGTVGRLNEVKRQSLLLQAVAVLGIGYEDVRILLVGDGPERGALEQLANQLGLSNRTHFAGYQPNPERFFPAMDVFALTSRLEGLPLVILEAWAASLPVVSSAVGGIPKLIHHGGNGLLFPNGNEKLLAECLRSLLSDHDKSSRLGRSGKTIVQQNYSLSRMAGDYEARYRELLKLG